jgi:hypothetical protein
LSVPGRVKCEASTQAAVAAGVNASRAIGLP